MGLEAPTESLSALANRPNHDLHCECIHKGVTTRAARTLATPTPWSVDRQPNAAVFSSPLSPIEPIEPIERHTDWSL